MRIAFFGSSLVSAYWNGAATYYRGIIRALHERGHEVTFFEPDAYERQIHRDIDDPPWAEVVVYAPAEWESALHRANGFDVVVKASGVGVHDAELECGILALDATTRIFWDVDAPATLERLEQDASDPLAYLVPQYDVVITYGGGDPVVTRYRALGARACVPIYNGLDAETHHRVAPERRFAADLSLLANRLPDREHRVETFFFGSADVAAGRRFLLGGSGWDDRPLPANVHHVGHVPTVDHNAWNSSTLAVLNVTRESMAANGWSPATRIFEAAGAGACLITDSWQGIDSFLEPDEEVLVADDGAEVAELLLGLTPARARSIGRAAQRRVLTEHTYTRRAATLDDVLLGVRA